MIFKRSVCHCLSNCIASATIYTKISTNPSLHFPSTKSLQFYRYKFPENFWKYVVSDDLCSDEQSKNTVSLDKKIYIFELRLPLQMNMKWKVSCICIFLLCNIWMIGFYETLLGQSLKINHEGWLWESSGSFDSVFSLIASPWFLIFNSLFRSTLLPTHLLYLQRTPC